METADFETEQLISEIELLTSRALQETQQWGSHQQGSPSKPTTTTSTIVEANNNPTNNNHVHWKNQAKKRYRMPITRKTSQKNKHLQRTT